ncbi:hypothetical protein PIROE2DRAFT_11117 [Piromyces sp. E2]|nr:hypothetical protein PIROE2DRAFT_11117 [Piromyces sp. E2]|eukprot:OUM62539.1 hypothetical protein PIROE2DRAFT_11117 [Piromyces sp. E2]
MDTQYSNYNFNTDCLSHGKYFGSIHKANCNKLLFAKFILPFLVNEGTNIMITHHWDLRIVAKTVSIGGILIFLFLAINQLMTQPYYSKTINNYRFAVYFSLCLYMLYGLMVGELGLNNSQFICDISLILQIIFFVTSYFINNNYYNKSLKRIYKKFHDKQITENLKNQVSKEYSIKDLEKPMKKNIYNSVERITKETFLNKEIKVFKNHHECEFACRFLRTNRNIEAFHLMKKLFEEGIRQFKHEADIYITAWYYVHTMKVFYKDNNLIKKYDMEIFNVNNILTDAMDLKLDLRKKFLMAKAESYIDIEKRENSMKIDTIDVEASIKLEELKNSVITIHAKSLYEIKELFTKLKNSTNVKDIAAYSENIDQISKLQNSGNSQYNYIIRQYPDDKNKDEIANPKLLEANSRKESTTSSPSKGIDRKALTASSNSLVSIPHSEDYSTTSGMGKDLRKKINSNVQNDANILVRNVNIPGAIKTATFGIRMLSYNIMLGEQKTYGKHLGLIKGILNYLDTINMESVNTYMDIPTSEYLFVPIGEYSYDSFEQKTIADSYKKLITNMKYCINRGMLNSNETVEDILYEPHFK